MFLAARPIGRINAVSARSKPSLSATKIATSEHSGKAMLSLERLTPIITSISPVRNT